MPQIASSTINSDEYWSSMYANGQFPTLDHNQRAKFAVIAQHVVGDSVLDVGCGECGVATRLDLQAVTYIGLDYADVEPHQSIPLRDRIRMIHGDLLEVEWPLADTVLLVDVIEHFEHPVRVTTKAMLAAKRRVVVCVPKSGLFTPQQNRQEHFWDFTHNELRLLLGQATRIEGPVHASCLCDVWVADV